MLSRSELAALSDEALSRFKQSGARGTVAIELSAAVAAAQVKILDLGRRIETLEQEIANFEHKGAYRSGERYAKNNLVQHGGSCWLCQVVTSATPGESTDWRLIAKRGKDAR